MYHWDLQTELYQQSVIMIQVKDVSKTGQNSLLLYANISTLVKGQGHWKRRKAVEDIA